MNRKKSVRKLLTILFSISAFVPLMAFSVIYWYVLRGYLDEDIRKMSHTALKALSLQTGALIFEEPRRLLPSLLMITSDSTDPTYIRSVLRAAKLPRQEILRFVMLSADRQIIAAYPDLVPGERFAPRSELLPGQVSYSFLFFENEENAPAIEVSYTIERRTLVCVLDLSGLSGKMLLNVLDEKDRIGVLDDRGRYLLCSDPSKVGTKDEIAANRMESFPVSVRTDEGRYYLSMLELSRSEWKSVYYRFQETADAPISAYLRLILFLALAGLIGSALVSYSVWRTITIPFRGFLGTIKAFAAGDYAVRIDSMPSIEFSAVSDAFNSMAEAIEQRDREIKRSEERYRVLFMGNRAPALIIHSESGNIRVVNPAAERYYGINAFDLDELTIQNLEADPSSEILKRLRDATQGNVAAVMTRHRLKSDAIRDVELCAGMIELDGQLFLYVLVFDVTERLLAEQRTEKALIEKTHLLQEVYHRDKNNQQLIVSLVRMQLDNLSGEKERAVLRKTQDRMFAMSLAHDLVYQSQDFSLLAAEELARGLISNYTSISGQPVLKIIMEEVDSIQLTLEKAVPFALAFNELLAVTFGSAAVASSLVLVRLKRTTDPCEREMAVLAVQHCDMTESDDESSDARLSKMLFKALVGQLGGTESWFAAHHDGSRHSEMRFPI